jgi:hypothetical protein
VIDFNFITPILATGGGLENYNDAEELALAGITHVVALNWEENDVVIMAGHPILTCLWNPTEDDGQPKSIEWFGESIEFGLSMLLKPWTKLYCHCKEGRNRGPSTALAVMLACGWEFDTAIDLIHIQRPVTYGYIKYATDAANAVKELGYLGE